VSPINRRGKKGHPSITRISRSFPRHDGRRSPRRAAALSGKALKAVVDLQYERPPIRREVGQFRATRVETRARVNSVAGEGAKTVCQSVPKCAARAATARGGRGGGEGRSHHVFPIARSAWRFGGDTPRFAHRGRTRRCGRGSGRSRLDVLIERGQGRGGAASAGIVGSPPSEGRVTFPLFAPATTLTCGSGKVFSEGRNVSV